MQKFYEVPKKFEFISTNIVELEPHFFCNVL